MFIYLYACIRKHLPVSLLSWPKMSPRTVTDGYHLWTTWKNVSNFFWKFWGWKWWWKIFYWTKSPSCRRFGPRSDRGSEKKHRHRCYQTLPKSKDMGDSPGFGGDFLGQIYNPWVSQQIFGNKFTQKPTKKAAAAAVGFICSHDFQKHHFFT